MTLKQLLAIVTTATLFFWIVWSTIIISIDPTGSGWFGFFLFYISLFFSLLGSFFLLTFMIRKVFNKMSLEYHIVSTSFRQSFSFAALVVGMLMLQSRDLLTVLSIACVIVALALLEFFFLSYRYQRI